MKVPLLDLKPQYRQIRADVIAAVETVLESQQFIMGAPVARLEKELAAYCSSRHAIACASGSDALILALMALDVGPGDEVITSPFSFYATASCIVRLGARPVFADIDPRSFNLDPASLAERITPRTKVIMPVHIFGQMTEMDPLLHLARKNGARIVEDAAQSIGAERGGRRAGSIGDIGCLSFFPSKNLGAFGDAGALTAQDDDLDARLRVLRLHGEKEKYVHYEVGLNSRLDALQAAILSVKLPYLDGWTEARRVNASRYDRLFAEAGLDPADVTPPWHDDTPGSGARHIFHQYTILARDRDALMRHLHAREIGCAVYYPVVLYRQPCFANLGYQTGYCPVAERTAARVLSLPIYPELTEEQQVAVVAAIAEFYR